MLEDAALCQSTGVVPNAMIKPHKWPQDAKDSVVEAILAPLLQPSKEERKQQRIPLDHGAEINAPGVKSGRTSLQTACAYGVGLDMIS